jgi:hypothetical protein
MAKKTKNPRQPTAKPRPAARVRANRNPDVGTYGIDVGEAGHALNEAQAILMLLRYRGPLNPQQMSDELNIPLKRLSNDLVFLLGLRLVQQSPSDPARFEVL